MSQLIVVGFKQDVFRASEVLNKLRAMDREWVVDLDDAVAVYRDHTAKLRVDQSYQLTTGEGAGWGVFWGSLIGALIAIPFTAGASGAALAAGALGGGALGATAGALDARWWKDEFGIPEEFANDVGGMIQPRDSAILALLRTVDPVEVAEEFRGYGGTILLTNLTNEQSAKVQAILNGSDRRFYAKASSQQETKTPVDVLSEHLVDVPTVRAGSAKARET
jgi:uncharacterized membrane protein